MAAIPFHRPPSRPLSKYETKTQSVTFTVKLFPQDPTDDRSLEHSVRRFSGTSGDPEDYLELRLALDDLFVRLDLQQPAEKFAHLRALLTNGALAVVTDKQNARRITSDVFNSCLAALRDEFLVPGTAASTKREVREARKGDLSVGTFVERLLTINTYFPLMPPPHNTVLSQDELKTILVRGMPESWQSSLTHSGNEHSHTFRQTIAFFTTIERQSNQAPPPFGPYEIGAANVPGLLTHQMGTNQASNIMLGDGPPAQKRMCLPDQSWSWLSLSQIPLRELNGPDTFVTQENWLENMVEAMADLAQKKDSENGSYRVPLTSLARCSRGGKTRALLELSKGLREQANIPTLFVSFNDSSDCQEEILRGDSCLSMLCRRIAFEARPLSQRSTSLENDFQDFQKYNISDSFVLNWLGNQEVVLLIDELNRVELDIHVVTFLKRHFCIKPGRYYVFSSHLSSTDPERALPSNSSRDFHVVDLPLIQDLSVAREALEIPELTPRLALYYGLIPALLVTSLTVDGMADARQVHRRVDNACDGLTMDFALFQRVMFSFFTGHAMESKIDVLLDASGGNNYWIPCYLMDLLTRLGLSIGGRFGLALRDIAIDTKGWSTCKEQSGDGWESLFLLVLWMRFADSQTNDVDWVPNISFNTTDVMMLSSLLFYNFPFPSDVSIAMIKTVEELHSALDKIAATYEWVGDFPKVSIYYPKLANFAEYDVVVCVWRRDATSGDVTRELYGYQLKEGVEIPRQNATLRNSYLVRGHAAMNSSEIRGWNCLSVADLRVFFGVSGERWLPERWRGLSESR